VQYAILLRDIKQFVVAGAAAFVVVILVVVWLAIFWQTPFV
jgi:hypothetical protein